MWKLFKTELYKVSRMPVFGCLLAAPIALFVYEICFPDRLTERGEAFQLFFGLSYSEGFYVYLMSKMALLNLILWVIACFQYMQIEQRNHCRNGLFTLPVKAGTVYGAKVGVLGVAVLLNNLLIFAAFSSSVLFFDSLEFPSALHFLYYGAGCVMLGFFHYTLAALTRNLILYLLVFVMLFAGCLLVNSSSWVYCIPYAYCDGFTAACNGKLEMETYLWYICIYTVLSISLGYFTFKRTQLWQK